MNGWIKLHRKLFKKSFSYKPEYLSIWIYILINVNHVENEFFWNNSTMIIPAGSGIFSQKKISELFKVDRAKVGRILKFLKSEHQIEHQTYSKFTLIKVIKWEDYQKNEHENEHQVNIKRTSSEHQVNTNKNVKKIKNEKKEISKEIEPTVQKDFGNEEINKILGFLKKSVGVSDFKESQKWTRIYGKHFLNLGKKIGKDELIRRMNGVLSDNFKAKNCNSIKYLYNEIKSFIHSPVIQSNQENRGSFSPIE
jgi:gas vesicle protein